MTRSTVHYWSALAYVGVTAVLSLLFQKSWEQLPW